jgi:argininosuccinate lyase
VSFRTRLFLASTLAVLVPLAVLALGVRREMDRRLGDESRRRGAAAVERLGADLVLERERIAARLDDGFLDATALMEYLIQRGVPMRSGHEIVGKLVAHCEAGGRKLSDLTLVEMHGACDAIGEDVFNVLGAANAAAALCSYGSGGPEQVATRLAHWINRLRP